VLGPSGATQGYAAAIGLLGCIVLVLVGLLGSFGGRPGGGPPPMPASAQDDAVWTGRPWVSSCAVTSDIWVSIWY
jgi:hypothetical protein